METWAVKLGDKLQLFLKTVELNVSNTLISKHSPPLAAFISLVSFSLFSESFKPFKLNVDASNRSQHENETEYKFNWSSRRVLKWERLIEFQLGDVLGFRRIFLSHPEVG